MSEINHPSCVGYNNNACSRVTSSGTTTTMSKTTTSRQVEHNVEIFWQYWLLNIYAVWYLSIKYWKYLREMNFFYTLKIKLGNLFLHRNKYLKYLVEFMLILFVVEIIKTEADLLPTHFIQFDFEESAFYLSFKF